MFGFAPPPSPEPAPTPCPQCGAAEAIRLYATVRTEYFRCVCCRLIRSVTRDDHDTPAAAA
jgi:Zn ribbon nucleic-acid-binding protein